MTKTFADMTPEERAECVGMFFNYEEEEYNPFVMTWYGRIKPDFYNSKDTEESVQEEEIAFFVRTDGGGEFAITPGEDDFSKYIPRFDLLRAWNPDGSPVKGSWVEAEYIGDSHGMKDVYYFDGTPTHRHFETEWETIPNA